MNSAFPDDLINAPNEDMPAARRGVFRRGSEYLASLSPACVCTSLRKARGAYRCQGRPAIGARPVWTIIVAITDKTTGERIEECELDSELRFDDRSQCESIVAKISPLPDSHFFASALTCRTLICVTKRQ
jgi:hypothetical protein